MHSFFRLAACIAVACCSSATGQLVGTNNATLPTSFFWTRPQANAPALSFTVQNGFSQGYIFIAPYQHPGAGPYIYDKFGNLIWDGFGIVGPANAMDFKVCTYQSQPHLCLSQVNQQNGYAVGQALVLNSNYRIVAQIQTGNDAMPADMHEFQLLDNGKKGATALVTSYRVIPFDLSYWNVTNGQGWLLNPMFQEIDVQTGAVLFEWLATNHVDPRSTQIKINSTSIAGGGNGLSASSPFDYFHLNSIDKSSSGNYLISGRHVATIYYINGTDRSIIWQLSYLGASDFTCSNFNFSFQHDARILLETDTTTEISFFDNAFDCDERTSPMSSGRFVTLDHTTGVATQTRQTLPPKNITSCSQGNTQLLEGGSVFNGWGDKGWFSERDPNDNLVLAGTFTNGAIDGASAMNYRAFSFEWQSTPNNTKPQVYSYALNKDSMNRIHVSWNGATTVQTWRFYGTEVMGDKFNVIGNATINGFETVWTAPGYYAWVMAEAVAWDGTSLGNSSYQPTFVPSSGIATYCSDTGCPAVTSYS